MAPQNAQQIQRGATSYHAGLAAEAIVKRHYERSGIRIDEERWRGSAGEIDLIGRDGETIVFVEVKKSTSFDKALARLKPRQVERLFLTAGEYLGTLPNGELTDARFDVALVDAHGQCKIVENPFL